jgi:ribosomal protein S18 acetylase RimI-like enzyme
MNIRLADAADAESISALVTHLTDRFVAHEFSEEGRETMLRSMAPEAIRGYIEKGFRYFVSESATGIDGVVATRDDTHLYHLFVAEHAQGQGLGTKLWHVARQACLDAGGTGEFTVFSSRQAVGFYEKLGFERESEVDDGGVLAVAMRCRPKELCTSR